MTSARALSTAACFLCLATAGAARSTSQGPEPPPPPAAPGASAPSAPSQVPATPPPHNPGQEIAGEEAAGSALDIGPAKLRIGGYLGVTGFYRSTNSGGGAGTNFATIPFEDTLQGNVSETRLTAQASRISIRVDAPFPEARFRKIAGYFEMDFNGATSGTIAVSSNSAGFRLRQAFAEVHFGDAFSLTAGQSFSLMTPVKNQLSPWPSDFEMSQAVDTNYIAGLVWERVPQVRFAWRPSTTFNWAASVENPEQQIGSGLVSMPACCGQDILVQYNTGTEALSVPNLMPDIVTRIAFNPTRSFHVDVGGLFRVFRHTLAPYDDVEHAPGGGVSVNLRVLPSRGTRLIGQFAHGAGLGRSVGGLAPDVAFRPDGSIEPIPVTAWVAGLEQAVTARLSLSGYYSGVTAARTAFVESDGSFIGFGYPGASREANKRITEVTATAWYLAVRTQNRGSAQLGVQTSWLQREPWSAGSGPGSANAFLLFVQMRYNLP